MVRTLELRVHNRPDLIHSPWTPTTRTTSMTASSITTEPRSPAVTARVSCKLVVYAQMAIRKLRATSTRTKDPSGKSLGPIPNTKASSQHVGWMEKFASGSAIRTTIGAKMAKSPTWTSSHLSTASLGPHGSTGSSWLRAQLREES